MKLIKTGFIIILLIIIVLVIFWRFIPSKMAEEIAKNSGPAKTLLCQYPAKISGEAMAPVFQNGQLVSFSKCIEDRENIAPGTIILYERPAGMRISVVRGKINQADGIMMYRVSQEARQNEIEEIKAEKIIAIYKQ